MKKINFNEIMLRVWYVYMPMIFGIIGFVVFSIALFNKQAQTNELFIGIVFSTILIIIPYKIIKWW